jgi:hypothetical protein
MGSIELGYNRAELRNSLTTHQKKMPRSILLIMTFCFSFTIKSLIIRVPLVSAEGETSLNLQT